MLKTLKKYLSTQSTNFNLILFFHFFFIAVLCGIHFVFHFIDFLHLQIPQNFFEGTLILTSMDAYHYAKGARDFLDLLNADPKLGEILRAFNTLHPLAILGGILAFCTNLGFVLTWSSVFFSVSTAVGLYWLVYQISIKVLRNDLWISLKLQSQSQDLLSLAPFIPLLSFLASLVAILSPSFYQRVGVGYFDTDMLLLTFPLFALLFLLQFLSTPRLSLKHLVLFALFGYLAIAWHNGIQNLLLLGFLFFLCLELINFFKMRRIVPKSILLISVFLVILTPSPFGFLVLIFLLFGIARFPQWFWVWLLFAVVYAVAFGLLNPLLAQINAYIFGATQYAKTYVYASVVNGILETMPSNLPTLISRSGGVEIFSLALFGFMSFGVVSVFPRFNPCRLRLLGWNLKTSLDFAKYGEKFKECKFLFFLLLPFCFLGLASIQLGMRFSFFLTPIIALGIAFFLLKFLSLFARFLVPSLLVVSAISALFIANLNYRIPQPILTHTEVQALKDLDSKLNPQDILLSWWDYGYALRYFTKAQVLLDGARHSGAINFPIAKILFSSSPTLFYNFSLQLAAAMQTHPSKEWNKIFEVLARDKGAEDYLKELESESTPITLVKGAKVYWILPLRILPLLANVYSFANVDLKNGKPLHSNTFVFWDSKQSPPNSTPQAIINLYDNFYTQYTTGQNQILLTQVNFGKNSLLLSDCYLKSNIIQILLFANYPNRVSVSGDIVRILRLD
ncbi:STT3 domain-containing protein [Helicobacter rodentium]|uniref:STT3 domain-containing protein n=1 Tax=Helicobacter rodentium TaxID=59617 RepID=UPI002557D948|nr:STT3 domain-containing protein [Helicobacter rodentium]